MGVNEAGVTRKLVTALIQHMPHALVLRHVVRFSAGIPDLSVSGGGRTTWWEVKLANPGCTSKEIQQYICARLDSANFCRYLIYELRTKNIWVVKPDHFTTWRQDGKAFPTMDAALEFMKEVHDAGHHHADHSE